jgi:hypothetical protein
MSTQPFNTSVLTFIEHNTNSDLAELTKSYLALQAIHEKTREASGKTNQAGSEYETYLRSQRLNNSQYGVIELRTRRAAYVSSMLNLWYLQDPLFEAMLALIRSLTELKQKKEENRYSGNFTTELVVANNLVAGEALLRNVLDTLRRINLGDLNTGDSASFLNHVLTDCLTNSWLNVLQTVHTIQPQALTQKQLVNLPHRARLIERCLNAIAGIEFQPGVELTRAVNCEDIPTDTAQEVAASLSSKEWLLTAQGNGRIYIERVEQY